MEAASKPVIANLRSQRWRMGLCFCHSLGGDSLRSSADAWGCVHTREPGSKSTEGACGHRLVRMYIQLRQKASVRSI